MAAPFVDVRTEKGISQTGDSVARLFPSTNWNVRAGWTAVFPASRSSFFAAREAGRRIRPSSWKEAPRARRISLGAGFSPGEQAGFPVLEHTRAAALFCAGTGFLSPGFLPDSCILSESCPSPFFLLERGLFMPFLRGNSPKGWRALDRKQEMFSNVGRGRVPPASCCSSSGVCHGECNMLLLWIIV